jgi:hypothetical protein
MNQLFAIQKQLADAVRFPNELAPHGIEQERLDVYRELVINNVANFVRSAFPVLRGICGDDVFDKKIRHFFQQSQLDSPYFVEIPEAFLGWLQENAADLPAFALELAHYEWLELELFRREEKGHPCRTPIIWSEQLPLESSDNDHQAIAISSLLEVAAFQYPVHQLSEHYQPIEPPEQPTFLAVYRGLDDQVHFMQLDALSTATIQLLQSSDYSFNELATVISQLIPQMNPVDVRAGILSLLDKLVIQGLVRYL